VSARHKLNQIAIQGCVVVGGILGCYCGSWLVFILASGVLLGLSLFLGDIRPTGSGPRGTRSPTRHQSQRGGHTPPPRRRK
jgi:hypothetical protein